MTSRSVGVERTRALDAMRPARGLVLRQPPARVNDLVGRHFVVGEVRLRGIRLSEPCRHLTKLIGVSLLKSLVHRSGLRAEILEDGLIPVGDPIRPA